MLRVHVQLVPVGVEADGREIARAEIGNIGGDPACADYHYRLSADAWHYAPALNHEGIVVEHQRRQSVWALLRQVLEDWWATTDGRPMQVDDGAGRIRALLDGNGRVLELTRGPWRMARVGPTAWLLLRGGTAHGRWSGLGISAARKRLLAAVPESEDASAEQASSSGGAAPCDTDPNQDG